MFKTKCLSPVWILFLIFCISAISQQPLTQGQIRHVNKVMKSLARFDAGTRLDVQLSDGFHHIGTLNESGPTTFVSRRFHNQQVPDLRLSRRKAREAFPK
jgi:hypothetical protein